MDFIERLPHFQGVNVIFVMIDRLSKFTHFLPKHSFNALDFSYTISWLSEINYLRQRHDILKLILEKSVQVKRNTSQI